VAIDDCLEVQIPINDVASIAQTDVRNLDDPRIETAELFHPGMLATFRQMPREAKDQAAIFAGLTGTFSQLAFLIGLENLLVAMVDDPERVQRALRRRHKVVRRQAVALCEAGARFVWIGEGMASGSLISPRMYQEFVLPYEQELADVLRDHGAWSVLHICGNATPMLPWMGASRVDGCDLDYLTDWPAAVRTLGTRLVLKGNINPMLLLPENQQNLAEACQQTKRLAGDAPGFILSTGCLVPRDADPSAFEIMAKTCAL
jgi:uroporphyrinogen decarboxylase